MCESCVFMWLLVAVPVAIVLMVIITVVMVALEERCQRRNKRAQEPCVSQRLETHIFERRTNSGTQLRQRMVVKCSRETVRDDESNHAIGSENIEEGRYKELVQVERSRRVGGYLDYDARGGEEFKGEDVDDMEQADGSEMSTGVESLDSSGRENAESYEDSFSSEDNVGRGEGAFFNGLVSSDGSRDSEGSEDIVKYFCNEYGSQEGDLTNSGSDEHDDDTKIRLILGNPSKRMVGD